MVIGFLIRFGRLKLGFAIFLNQNYDITIHIQI